MKLTTIYLLAVIGILLLTWPWVLHFNGEFINHWDPPFHAWKLEFMARAILNGDPLLLRTEANVIYPYNGTLYYEALQWPPAWFATLLLLLTRWPFEMIYHVTLVAFWALSAPCMYLLLRELRLGRAAAITGALLFTLVPHRISYMVEFQMELIYAIPLYFLCLIRFLKHQTIVAGVLLALTWWLQAVSELYQAVFLLIATPFVAAPFIMKHPAMLLSRRFWRGTVAALLTSGLTLYPLLTPYLMQRSGGAVKRLMSEITRHAAQPLSYFTPFNRLTPWHITARQTELSLYPTAVVMLLTVAAVFIRLFRRRPTTETRHEHLKHNLSAIPPVLLALFLLLAFLFLYRPGIGGYTLLLLWDFLAVITVISAALMVFLPERQASTRSLFLRGLTGAAILAYFLSLGPFLSIGKYSSDISQAAVFTHNTVFNSAYKHWLPPISGFRVVSRFGVITLFFLICVAATTLNQVLQYLYLQGGWQRNTRHLLPLVVLLLMGLESLALPIRSLDYRPVDRADTPLLQRLKQREQPFVLAMIPMGDRMLEGMRMFSILRNEYLSVFAWGGYLPHYTQTVKDAIGRFNTPRTLERLSMLWPECLLLVDHSLPCNSDAEVDYVAIFSACASVIDEDARFTLMQLHAAAPANTVRRLFRSDFARHLPFARATINTTAPCNITVTLNGHPVDRLKLPAGSHNFQQRLVRKQLARAGTNELKFISDGQPFTLTDFGLFSVVESR